MNNFIIYSAEVTISLALFYSAYWLFLKNETFFKLNRFYLVASIIISMLAPVLNIKLTANSDESFLTKYLISPVEQYEHRFMGGMSETGSSLYDEMINGPHPDHVKKPVDGSAKDFTSNSSQSAPIDLNKGSSGFKLDWMTILSFIYSAGAALLLVRMLVSFIWLIRNALKQKTQITAGMKLIRLEKNISPFSFFNFIFIGNKEYPDAELSKIISHEKVHSGQKHAFDLILFELLLIFQWFNPFVWLYKRALKINHEYLADQGTINSGVDIPSYQYSLLNQVLQENNIEVVSTYNLSIKKRIAMMLKKRSSKLAALKLTIALPILVFLLSAFAFNVNTSKKDATPKGSDKLIVNKDTIKKVPVSVEYLKLLEGEYVSTNEPNRVRRIVFTELFGELLAMDNGYTCRPIFVGNGKFINPDDNQTLVFDIKDKNNISMLLFGKINLNKVKVQKGEYANRSLAYSTANVMEKEGIEAAQAFYTTRKDSSNYYGIDDELNYAGYQMLERGKAKEAAAIFKIYISASPNSFNAHDSYGEALLALGDKTGATEAFKRSLRLNPGNKNAIKRLKELGVNPDDVVKIPKLSKEYLKLLEGNYLSTNDGNWIRWIKFTEENGVLWGLDNGYRYQLIPIGEGKFVNPDDGASLVFDTKDKNNISLLLFGKINLKKTKLSKGPVLNTKEYAGVYTPVVKDSVMKFFEVRYQGNKLFRFIEAEVAVANGNVELVFVTDNIFFYTDNSGRSIEFTLNDKKEVTGCTVRRYDGIYKFTKSK